MIVICTGYSSRLFLLGGLIHQHSKWYEERKKEELLYSSKWRKKRRARGKEGEQSAMSSSAERRAPTTDGWGAPQLHPSRCSTRCSVFCAACAAVAGATLNDICTPDMDDDLFSLLSVNFTHCLPLLGGTEWCMYMDEGSRCVYVVPPSVFFFCTLLLHDSRAIYICLCSFLSLHSTAFSFLFLLSAPLTVPFFQQPPSSCFTRNTVDKERREGGRRERKEAETSGCRGCRLH